MGDKNDKKFDNFGSEATQRDKKIDTRSNILDDTMVNIARNALTPEQAEEYKKVGEFMYNDNTFRQISMGPTIKPSTSIDYIATATESLKAGLDPKDLSRSELQALIEVYGERWFEKFEISEQDAKEVLEINLNISSRQQKRLYKRQCEKQARKEAILEKAKAKTKDKSKKET
jgi:hypothetical protein